MNAAPVFTELLERLEDGQATVGLASRSASGLGRMLLVEVRLDGDVIGLYPTPLAEPERAALLLQDCPVPELGPMPHSKALIHTASGSGLEVRIGRDGVLLTHPALGEVLRHPTPNGDLEATCAQTRGYVDAAGGLGGLVMRTCAACARERPLRDFFADAGDPRHLLPECRDDWHDDQDIRRRLTAAGSSKRAAK
jgi:hypothetical protein